MTYRHTCGMVLAMTTPRSASVAEVLLCEVEVWDGGEYVYCHAPATRRDRDGFWRCPEHPERGR